MSDTIESAIARVEATVGVSAKHLSTDEEFAHNADQLFFTASTLKVPLLTAMYRKVDRGELDPQERFELVDDMRVPGSGVLKALGKGLNPTLHDLAILMIIISDNTATDIIYNLVGRDELSRLTGELGLERTRIHMTTRELLYSVVGLNPTNPDHTFEMASDKLFTQEYVIDADAFSLDTSDVSSPSEMCRLLELIHNGDILTDSSREAVLDILKRQQLNTVIPLKLPVGTEAAHKTGSYHGVRCDVGIVYSPNGPYTVAIMAKDVSSGRLETDLALAEVSRAVYDRFVG